MFGRLGVGVVVGVMALVGSSLAWAPRAQAHAQKAVACMGQESTTYRPGLTLTPASIAVSADGSYACTDAPGHEVGAVGHIEGVSPDGTCLALNSPRGQEVVEFGDGGTSVIRYTSGLAARLLGVNTVRLEGLVVKGRYRGARAVRSMQLAPGGLPTDCLGDGIRHAVGGVELELTP